MAYSHFSENGNSKATNSKVITLRLYLSVMLSVFTIFFVKISWSPTCSSLLNNLKLVMATSGCVFFLDMLLGSKRRTPLVVHKYSMPRSSLKAEFKWYSLSKKGKFKNSCKL